MRNEMEMKGEMYARTKRVNGRIGCSLSSAQAVIGV